MPATPLHQPHDKLFKQGFKDPETAAGFLNAYLPEAVAAAVDWPQLALQPGSFVDSQFRAHESDLLFSAPLSGREAMFYFLFDAICGTPAGIMVMRVMKAERSHLLLTDPVWDEEILRQVPQAVFEMLLRFIVNADIDTAEVECRVTSIQSDKLRNTAMTYAQKLHQEGRQEGQQSAVIDALEIRFQAIPEGLREEIERIADPQRLQILHRAAIQAASLEEFSRSL